MKSAEHRPAKLKKVKPAEPKPVATEKKDEPRKCCGTAKGQSVPHAETCPSLNPKPKFHPGLGRWPSGTSVTCLWTGEQWELSVSVAGEEKPRTFQGTGIHQVFIKAFRIWKFETTGEKTVASDKRAG